jgi:hypothetical protein
VTKELIRTEPPSIDGGSVLLAYVHPGTVVHHNFHSSMMNLLRYDFVHSDRIGRVGGPVAIRCGTGGLVEARNESVRYFLAQGTAEWLWLVDTDMGFRPDILERLIDAADPAERPVMGALCFGMRMAESDGFGGFRSLPFPVLYDWAMDSDGAVGFSTRLDYSPNTVTRVAGTGAACLLIHRSAITKLVERYPNGVFDQTRYPNGKPVSEDLSFCWRLTQAEIPIFVHTGVQTTHCKTVWVSEDTYVTHRIAMGTAVRVEEK